MGRKIEQMLWAGGEHDFALYLGEIEALQQRLDAGPEHILRRILNGDWKQEDLFETIRLGLVGGGMEALDARKIMDKIKVDCPLRTLVMPAQSILAAALVGVEDDPVGKMEGETDQAATPSPEENGSSPISTETGPL